METAPWKHEIHQLQIVPNVFLAQPPEHTKLNGIRVKNGELLLRFVGIPDRDWEVMIELRHVCGSISNGQCMNGFDLNDYDKLSVPFHWDHGEIASTINSFTTHFRLYYSTLTHRRFGITQTLDLAGAHFSVDHRNKHVYFVSRRGHLSRANFKTKAIQVVKEWLPNEDAFSTLVCTPSDWILVACLVESTQTHKLYGFHPSGGHMWFLCDVKMSTINRMELYEPPSKSQFQEIVILVNELCFLGCLPPLAKIIVEMIGLPTLFLANSEQIQIMTLARFFFDPPPSHV